jgi:chloramphenicol-sensitive protein RarD
VNRGTAKGFAGVLAASVTWGLIPLYFRQVSHLAAATVLAHRILWTTLIMAIALGVGRRLGTLLRLPGRRAAGVAIAAALLGANWGVFVWAVYANRVVECSLGYYINPIVSIVIGRFVLGERLTRAQLAAAALTTAGVAVLAWRLGSLPWLSIFLATSFALYSLARKRTALDPGPALLGEMAMLAPLALAWLVVQAHRGEPALGVDATDVAWLVAGGVVTAGPFYLFGVGVARLPLSTVGILQFVSPSIQLLLSVFVFGEAFTPVHAVAFGAIWAGLVLYTWNP